MEKIPGWVEEIFTPKINELIGEVKALDMKVDSLRNEMLARFEAVDAKFEAVDSGFDSLEAKVEFEARLAELDRKLAKV